AADCYTQAREIAHEIRDEWGEADFTRDQGDAAWIDGHFDEAQDRYEEALQLSQKIGDRWGEADTMQKLGNVAWKLGQASRAERLYRSALFVYRQISARRSEAECLNIHSRLRVTSNDDEIPYDPASAAEKLQAAQILESIGPNDHA